MKKVLVLIAVLLMYSSMAEASAKHVAPKYEAANVRQAMTLDAPIIGVLRVGDAAEVVDDKIPRWFKVRIKSGEGYVRRWTVTAGAPGAPQKIATTAKVAAAKPAPLVKTPPRASASVEVTFVPVADTASPVTPEPAQTILPLVKPPQEVSAPKPSDPEVKPTAQAVISVMSADTTEQDGLKVALGQCREQLTTSEGQRQDLQQVLNAERQLATAGKSDAEAAQREITALRKELDTKDKALIACKQASGNGEELKELRASKDATLKSMATLQAEHGKLTLELNRLRSEVDALRQISNNPVSRFLANNQPETVFLTGVGEVAMYSFGSLSVFEVPKNKSKAAYATLGAAAVEKYTGADKIYYVLDKQTLSRK